MQLPDIAVVRGLLASAGLSADVEAVQHLGVVCRVPAPEARDSVMALRGSSLAFGFLVDLFGIDTGEGIDVVYRLRSIARDEDVLVKSAHAYDAELRSVWDLFPAALMPERELCELFGLQLAGHPNPKRLLTTDGCAPYLRKDVEVRGAEVVRDRSAQVVDPARLERTTGSLSAAPRPSETVVSSDAFDRTDRGGDLIVPDTLPADLKRVPRGVDLTQTEHLTINMGPQHPSTHGVLRLILELAGEEVVGGEAVIGYLHRGIEKLAESRRYSAVGTLLDRGDYVSGIHNELAFALAAERIAEIEVPPRAHYLRSLMGEINRISSHLVWYGPMGLDTGAMGQFLYAFRDREALLDVLEDVTGGRMMFNYVRPGGVVRDITTTAEAKIRTFLGTFDMYLEENAELLMGNEIFQARTRGVGKLSREGALAFGLSGANLRASGVNWDIRRERPYAAYEELEFDVPIAEDGDVYARCAVRLEEMRQSARIVRQCLDGIPEGDHTAKVAKVLRPPAGEAYAAVESPRGELGIHVVSDGSDTPYRMRYRPPALYALQAGEAYMPGLLIADAVVLMGSLDLILGEVDR